MPSMLAATGVTSVSNDSVIWRNASLFQPGFPVIIIDLFKHCPGSGFPGSVTLQYFVTQNQFMTVAAPIGIGLANLIKKNYRMPYPRYQ